MTLFYGVIASIWILFSDWMLAGFTSDPALFEKISSYKGLAFVIVTSALLYFELRRQLHRWAKEVDARQKAEREIRINEARFRSYVENAPVAVFVVNRPGKFVDANAAASELLGHDSAELLCLGIADVVAKSERERVLKEFAGLEAGGQIEREYILLKRDGTTVFAWLRAVKITEDRFLAFCQDITKLKQSEADLQKSKAQIQYVLNNTRDVIFQIDLKGNYIFGNAAAERLTGYPLSQLLQMSMWQLVPAEYHALLKERLQRRIAGETMENNFEFEIRHQDGHRIWLELTTNGVLDADGKLTAIQGVARDISDRKQAEEKFIHEQTRFKLIFDTIPIGIAFHTVHPDGSFTRIINDAHLNICGLNRADHDKPEIYK
ncbi:MAG TPA: PAS domain S-box protein, partial [Candidatus Binatia bacterium]|nr:PAS domain S-box protein [Candidatus Binatia bacterium]